MKYKVYFEIFGKKMKTEVNAISSEAAKKAVKDKIIFHKVEEVDNMVDHLKDMFGITK